MKLSPTEQESLIALLTRIYLDIRSIEEEFQLLVGVDDFRPRVEYFHDAMRAFTSQNPKHREAGGRLSIEMLAYDLSCMRYIQSMPLAPFRPHGHILSSGTDIVTAGIGLTVKARRPDRAVRERICELYQHYAVLFAALLKTFADADYNNRIKDLNQDVQDIHALVQQLEGLAKKKGSLEQVATAVAHLEEDDLRQALTTVMQRQHLQKKEDVAKVVGVLKAHVMKKDKDIAAIEAAHMNYVLAQLGIFEGSKDLLKKMAAQGMNLVGKFVENAIAESRRQVGR